MANARFKSPHDLTVDGAGNLYVLDDSEDGKRVNVRKISISGSITTMKLPQGDEYIEVSAIAVDYAGNLYVAQSWGSRIIKIAPSGKTSVAVGKSGSLGVVLGTLPGSLAFPNSVFVDSAGNLYATSLNAVLKIRLPAQ